QTVLGPLEPEQLGQVLMHEHVLWDIRPPKLRQSNDQGAAIDLTNVWRINYGELLSGSNLWLSREFLDVATAEVMEVRAAGGSTIVELSCGGLDPDPQGLVRISQGTGVHLVMGCGHYVNDYQDPRNARRTVDDFAREMIDQVQRGAWGTDVRAGMIGEMGCQAPWTGQEQRVMRAALLAQAETGAAVNV